jgi:hypothetical protein
MHRIGFLASLLILLACTGGGDSQPTDAHEQEGGGGSGGAPAASRLSLNDVSILVPLPADEGLRAAHLWLMPGDGEAGPYFPAAYVAELPSLNADLPDMWPVVMVTAVRFDPCFQASRDAACQAQLRLGAQPVFFYPSGAPRMTDDAAAHLFYVLDDADATEVVASLRALKALSPVPTDGPLGVHPGLEAATMESDIGAALRELVVRHCREDNFLRITVNSFAMDNWGFRKFDVSDDGLVRQPLTGMTSEDTSQAWARQAEINSLEDPSGTVSPASADGFSYFLSAANWSDGAPVDAAAAREAAGAIARIDNPSLRLVEESDCVSCHLATHARIFGKRHGVSFDGLEDDYQVPDGYDTTLSLAPEMQGNLGVTINFGYHNYHIAGVEEIMVSVSRRVIHESVEVARALDAQP